MVGATSVCFLVGECGAGAICRLCHRCARVARGRGSRLAPLGHGPCARSMSARAAGHWPSVAGRTSLPLRGRLWTLTYVYGTVFARLGGGRALAGRCGGGVGGVVGASTMRMCADTHGCVCALVCCMCLYVVKIAPHLIFARQCVCALDIFRYQHSLYGHDLDRD